MTTDEPTRDEALVRATAHALGLKVDPADLPAVAAHLALLLGFARDLGDSDAEPAPVFLP